MTFKRVAFMLVISPDDMYLRTETVGHHRGSRNIHCINFGATFFGLW